MNRVGRLLFNGEVSDSAIVDDPIPNYNTKIRRNTKERSEAVALGNRFRHLLKLFRVWKGGVTGEVEDHDVVEEDEDKDDDDSTIPSEEEDDTWKRKRPSWIQMGWPAWL